MHLMADEALAVHSARCLLDSRSENSLEFVIAAVEHESMVCTYRVLLHIWLCTYNKQCIVFMYNGIVSLAYSFRRSPVEFYIAYEFIFTYICIYIYIYIMHTYIWPKVFHCA